MSFSNAVLSASVLFVAGSFQTVLKGICAAVLEKWFQSSLTQCSPQEMPALCWFGFVLCWETTERDCFHSCE